MRRKRRKKLVILVVSMDKDTCQPCCPDFNPWDPHCERREREIQFLYCPLISVHVWVPTSSRHAHTHIHMCTCMHKYSDTHTHTSAHAHTHTLRLTHIHTANRCNFLKRTGLSTGTQNVHSLDCGYSVTSFLILLPPCLP